MSKNLIPVFVCELVFGKLFFKNRSKFDEYLRGLRDGEYQLVLKKPEEPQKEISDPQRRYYRGVVCKLIADDTGYTNDEVHEFLAWEFLQIPDQAIKVRKSTGKGGMSTVEMEEYLAKCRTWAAEVRHFTIPLPNEVEGYEYTL